MRNILFFLLISLLFTACVPKITIEALRSPKVTHPAIQQLAVMNFKNDTIGQASSIEALLTNVRLKNKPYFTLIQRNNLDLILNEKKLNDSALVDIENLEDFRGLTEVKTFLMGEVLTSTMNQKFYFKSETNYQHCLEYNKEKKCIRFPVKLVRCQTNDYTVQTQIKAVEVTSSDILYAQTYTQTDSISNCNNINNFPTKEKHNHYLASLIAKKVSQDLAPYYVSLQVPLLEDLDIELLKTQTQQFKNALELLKQSRYEKANILLEELNNNTNEKSYVILYNLALSYEALNQIEHAFSLYQEAEMVALNDEVIEEISQAIIRIQNTIQEKNRLNESMKY